MAIHESGQMYLETIYILRQTKSFVRAIDVGEQMGYTKPSISRAISMLKKDGLITRDREGHICLTEKGTLAAEKVYERHCFFMERLVAAGIAPDIAEKEACRMEHAISEESFEKLKRMGNK